LYTSTQEGRWKDITELPYKSSRTDKFRLVSRFPIIKGDESNPIETRYFEIQPGGYSSLEWHEHPHTVIIVKGSGSLIMGNQYDELYPRDIVYIAPKCMHQFLADRNESLGFICVVPAHRDRPRYPSRDEIQEQITNTQVLNKIRPSVDMSQDS
jgi:quercetin dioxygenase-like cupin family protein